MYTLAFALSVVVAVLAVVVAVRNRSYRPLAAFLVWFVVVDLVRTPLGAYFLNDRSRPRVGLIRVVFHLDQVLYLSADFLLAALAVHYFLNRRPWLPLLAWAATALACLDYPYFSGKRLGAVYVAVTAVCTLVLWACALVAIVRGRRAPELSHLTLALFGAAYLTMLLGPMWLGIFENWWGVQYANVLLFTVLLVAHLLWLGRDRWFSRRPSSLSSASSSSA